MTPGNPPCSLLRATRQQEFLPCPEPEGPSCLILDIRLPGISGLRLQAQLAKANRLVPMIFVTAYADISMAVRAMKAGATDFLTKPWRDQDLVDAINTALRRDTLRLEKEVELLKLRCRFAFLSPRERAVFDLVVSGMLNKQIAARIGITENTVMSHRSSAKEKMQASSMADLVQMSELLTGINAPVHFHGWKARYAS